MIKEILRGHTSFENAYEIADYPYGFTLRCKKRCWIETADKGKGKGQMRTMECTSNPKKSILVWNKPKASVYSAFLIMYLNEDAHVKYGGISIFPWAEELQKFINEFAVHLNTEEKAFVKRL